MGKKGGEWKEKEDKEKGVKWWENHHRKDPETGKIIKTRKLGDWLQRSAKRFSEPLEDPEQEKQASELRTSWLKEKVWEAQSAKAGGVCYRKVGSDVIEVDLLVAARRDVCYPPIAKKSAA